MKVIFLDVDGVLNSIKDYDEHYKDSENKPILYDDVEERPLLLLKELVDKTGAKIVVSSSWRKIEKLYHKLGNALYEYGMRIYDVTPYRYNKDRSDEIYEWLYDKNIESFVILDDDNFKFEESGLGKYLIKTTYDDGLRTEHIEKAIKILNGECE